MIKHKITMALESISRRFTPLPYLAKIGVVFIPGVFLGIALDASTSPDLIKEAEVERVVDWQDRQLNDLATLVTKERKQPLTSAVQFTSLDGETVSLSSETSDSKQTQNRNLVASTNLNNDELAYLTESVLEPAPSENSVSQKQTDVQDPMDSQVEALLSSVLDKPTVVAQAADKDLLAFSPEKKPEEISHKEEEVKKVETVNNSEQQTEIPSPEKKDSKSLEKYKVALAQTKEEKTAPTKKEAKVETPVKKVQNPPSTKSKQATRQKEPPKKVVTVSTAPKPKAKKTTTKKKTKSTSKSKKSRVLTLERKDTNEKIRITYYRNGRYEQEALSATARLMRDKWGKVGRIDPKLLDYLYFTQRKAGSKGVVKIISGYRSPSYNAMLRRKSGKVARHSTHMDGKAIDFYFSDVSIKKTRRAAISLKMGGVGYYPGQWLHIDTGTFRTW